MNELVPYGKHKGKEWADVPKGYLEFIGNLKDPDSELPYLCRKELEARNKRARDLKIVPSAIDSASFCAIKMWRESLESGEFNRGFYSYVYALTKHAMDVGEPDEENNIHFAGLIFGIQWGELYPTVKYIKKSETKKN